MVLFHQVPGDDSDPIPVTFVKSRTRTGDSGAARDQRVAGSNPVIPAMKVKGFQRPGLHPFSVCRFLILSFRIFEVRADGIMGFPGGNGRPGAECIMKTIQQAGSVLLPPSSCRRGRHPLAGQKNEVPFRASYPSGAVAEGRDIRADGGTEKNSGNRDRRAGSAARSGDHSGTGRRRIDRHIRTGQP